MITVARPFTPLQPKPRLRFGRYREGTGRIAFASAKAGTSAEVCEPHQVLAHLSDVAASETAVFVLLPNGRKVRGRLGFPQLDCMLLPFWCPKGRRLPRLAACRASLHYRAAELSFALETAVRPRWQGLLWQLTIPATLDATSVRLASRHDLPGWFFDYRSPRGGGFGRLVDLSTTGVAVVAPVGPTTPSKGHTLAGALVGPAGERIPVRATVRRAAPLNDKQIRLGTSFEHIGFKNVVRVANLVRRCQREHQASAA